MQRYYSIENQTHATLEFKNELGTSYYNHLKPHTLVVREALGCLVLLRSCIKPGWQYNRCTRRLFSDAKLKITSSLLRLPGDVFPRCLGMSGD